MKNLRKLLSVAAAILLLSACSENKYYYDVTPPSPPTNIYTITGDNRVDIMWSHSPERDVAGYNIYVNSSYEGRYELIGNTQDNYFIDLGAVNGVTYYYGISAYDLNGNESELSYEVVYDTPRPEGFNQSIFDYIQYPDNSGYSFADYLVLPFDNDNTDFFFENYNGTFYLDVWADTDIQDMGPTNDIYDISQAPLEGWVPLNEGENIKYVEAIEGHTYVIWTWDNHFAKIRLTLVTPQRIVFDWAYQTAVGNPELKSSRGSGTRKIGGNVIRK